MMCDLNKIYTHILIYSKNYNTLLFRDLYYPFPQKKSSINVVFLA